VGTIAAKPRRLRGAIMRVFQRVALVESREKGLALGHEICISARSAP
jgi:hypothetical protein